MIQKYEEKNKKETYSSTSSTHQIMPEAIVYLTETEICQKCKRRNAVVHARLKSFAQIAIYVLFEE